jgi:hypothetical protein
MWDSIFFFFFFQQDAAAAAKFSVTAQGMCRHHLKGGCRDGAKCGFSHQFVLADFSKKVRADMERFLSGEFKKKPDGASRDKGSKALALIPDIEYGGKGEGGLALTLATRLDEMQRTLQQEKQMAVLQKQLETMQMREALREVEQKTKGNYL